jgi:hypothetical protein
MGSLFEDRSCWFGHTHLHRMKAIILRLHNEVINRYIYNTNGYDKAKSYGLKT